jgi:hypothetical protein
MDVKRLWCRQERSFLRRFWKSDAFDRPTFPSPRQASEYRFLVPEEFFQAHQRYRAGEVCLQAAIGVFGGQLSYWYSRRLADNESDQKTQYPIYVRHGWRSRSEPFDAIPRRLCADLTSLLLARRLGVLHHFVNAYRPLYIPHGAPLRPPVLYRPVELARAFGNFDRAAA